MIGVNISPDYFDTLMCCSRILLNDREEQGLMDDLIRLVRVVRFFVAKAGNLPKLDS